MHLLYLRVVVWNLEARIKMSEVSAARQAVSTRAAERYENREPELVHLPGPTGRAEEVVAYGKKIMAITQMEMQKLLHNQWDIVTRSIQPVLWLLLFGGGFSRLRVLPAGYGSYIDFVTPGILAQSVLTISIFQGIMVIWERDQGTLQKFLVSP